MFCYILHCNSTYSHLFTSSLLKFIAQNHFVLYLVPRLTKLEMLFFLSLYFEKKTSSEEQIGEKSFLSFDILINMAFLYLLVIFLCNVN